MKSLFILSFLFSLSQACTNDDARDLKNKCALIKCYADYECNSKTCDLISSRCKNIVNETPWLVAIAIGVVIILGVIVGGFICRCHKRK